MIQSMTGYARYEQKADWGTAVWEIRSVTQRYLETYSVCRKPSARWKTHYVSSFVKSCNAAKWNAN